MYKIGDIVTYKKESKKCMSVVTQVHHSGVFVATSTLNQTFFKYSDIKPLKSKE